MIVNNLKERKELNHQFWGSWQYMAYDDSLNSRKKNLRYPGYLKLRKIDETISMMAHFCSKEFWTELELYHMFQAVSQLYNISIDALFDKVMVNAPPDYKRYVSQVMSSRAVV